MNNDKIQQQLIRLEEEYGKLRGELEYLSYSKGELRHILDTIQSSKAYRFWQKINAIKRIIPMLPQLIRIKSLKNMMRRFKHITSVSHPINNKQDLYKKYEFTKTKHLPLVSVISVFYRKEREIGHFLEALGRQTYRGKFEIILVDNSSPDSSYEIVAEFTKEIKQQKENPLSSITVIRNKENLGNCPARNMAVKKAKGDIVVIIDSDCLVNKNFISSLVAAHLYNDCDVIIGPLNIETGERSPKQALDDYEHHPEWILRDAMLQDPINRNSFLNCITRNFSVKQSYLKKHYRKELLFDNLFTYTNKNPKSGFGWEDIEMAYRLYKKGARIKFIEQAYTIHMSHPPVAAKDEEKPYRVLLNFRRLFEKHPELFYITRRWTQDTYQKILAYMKQYNLPKNENNIYLETMFQKYLPPPFYIGSKRKLRVLTYKWHSSHQYELYKLPYQFDLVTDIDSGHTNHWDFSRRPMPQNARFIHVDEVNPNDYDLAILHFDENVLAYQNTNGVIGKDWGSSFRWFVENVDIPKVAICHGTPQFFGQYDHKHERPDLEIKVNEKSRRQLVDFIGDILVVTNSHQARKEWMFKNAKTIWHGFDPSEFLPSTYQKGILTLGKMMQERPHYRGYYLYKKVVGSNNKLKAESLLVPEPHELYDRNSNLYAFAKFQNYVDAIRQYSIYFNPTLRSPMPRSRGEAMMCGLVMVTAKNHDVEMFIKHGWNGFYSNNPDELREFLIYLTKHPERAKEIGVRGCMTAIDIFNHDRYLQEWENTITDLIK